MNLKIIGGALLIVGTSIGGGMLALPIATAPSGFLGALLLLWCLDHHDLWRLINS
jgi:tyrosine-specific transport protein